MYLAFAIELHCNLIGHPWQIFIDSHVPHQAVAFASSMAKVKDYKQENATLWRQDKK